MSKDIFTLRDSDGRLLKYDGIGWNTIGTYTPASWPANQYRLWSLFSYKGYLYTFWMSNTSNTTYNIGRFDGTDVTLVSSNTPGSSSINQRKSNWVNYRGVMYCVLRRTNSANFIILSFDGTTLSVRSATEMGAYNTPGNDQGLELASMNLFVHDERLFLGGRNIVPYSTTEYRVRNWLFELDIQSGNVTSVAIPLVDATSTNVHYSATNSMTDLQLFNALTKGGTHSFSLNGKLYRISPDGIVNLISDANYSITPAFDIRDLAIKLHGNVVTTAAGSATYPIQFANTTDMGTWHPLTVGSKVDYLGTEGIVVGFNTAALNQLRVTKLDGTAFPTVPNGATVSVKRGIAAPFSSASVTSFALTYITTKVVNGIAYIFISGRHPLQTAANSPAAFRSFMIKWDGVNPATTYELLVAGLRPNCWGSDAYLDPEDNKIHVIWNDAFTANTQHAYFDTVGDTWTVVGTVGSWSYNVSRLGAGQNYHFGWKLNEGDSTIESIANNIAGTQATLTYKLYSLDSHAINIAVEYDVGNGYLTATSAGGDGVTALTSSPAGTTHTFIHNNAVDLPSYAGPIQYRIRILP